MSSSDPPGAPAKRAALPPPPAAHDELPESLAVPRMEPPPSSLGAMVRPRVAEPQGESRETSAWLILSLLLVAGVATTIYLYR